jgi:hypothetical protein
MIRLRSLTNKKSVVYRCRTIESGKLSGLAINKGFADMEYAIDSPQETKGHMTLCDSSLNSVPCDQCGGTGAVSPPHASIYFLEPQQHDTAPQHYL